MLKRLKLMKKGNDMIRVVPIQKCVESPLQRIRLVCIDENGQYTSTDLVVDQELYNPVFPLSHQAP